MAQPNLLLVSIMEAQWYSVDPKERDALRHLLYTLNVMPYDGLGPTDQVATFFVPYDALEDITPFFAATNHYWLVGTSPTARISLLATTQEALAAEVMGIKTQFHLVLADFKGAVIEDGFMWGCKNVITLAAYDPHVTHIGDGFLRGCSSLTSLDVSGMGAVTHIGRSFLVGCSSLTSLDVSVMRAVTHIGSDCFLAGCDRLPPCPTRAAWIASKNH